MKIFKLHLGIYIYQISTRLCKGTKLKHTSLYVFYGLSLVILASNTISCLPLVCDHGCPCNNQFFSLGVNHGIIVNISMYIVFMDEGVVQNPINQFCYHFLIMICFCLLLVCIGITTNVTKSQQNVVLRFWNGLPICLFSLLLLKVYE